MSDGASLDALTLWEATFPYRLTGGVAFFVVLGLRDWRRNPEDPRRAKEYLFLAAATGLAVAYGVAHDHVTATISPGYFRKAKGLWDDPRPFRWAVTLLAVQATYWVGLLAGAALLVANNPRADRPQVPYPALLRLAALPLGTALVGAVLGAVAFAAEWPPLPLRETALGYVPAAAAGRFLVTWGMHTGSYAGGALGAIAAVVAVVRRRARARPG